MRSPTILLALITALLWPSFAGAGLSQRLQRLDPKLRREAALQIVKRTFDNRFNTDGRLLKAVNHAHRPYLAEKLQLDKLLEGTSIVEQQRTALNVLVAHPFVNERLASIAASKLRNLGDKSSYLALERAMFRGGGKLIPEVARAVAEIGKRVGTPDRKALDLGRYKNKRAQVEAILKYGRIESVKPLETENRHAFSAYVVSFEDRIDGQQVKALFKPTGAEHRENWLVFEKGLHRKRGAFSFMSREVFSYEFDKRVEAGRVPPTVAAVVKVPELGASMGSLQYFIPGGKTFGRTWNETRLRYRDFEASKDGIKQLDAVKLMAWIGASPEHVSCEVRGGNKGNLFVADQNPFPPKRGAEGGWRVMMIDNAASWTNIIEMHERGDWMVPLRFDKRLKRNLRKLDQDTFIDWATPFIGQDEAKGAWWRIQRALELSKHRPEWSFAPTMLAQPSLQLAA